MGVFTVRITQFDKIADFTLSADQYAKFCINQSHSRFGSRFNALDFCEKYGKQIAVYTYDYRWNVFKKISTDEK